MNVYNHYKFEVVNEFNHGQNNKASLKIKRIIVLGNKCYFRLSEHFRDEHSLEKLNSDYIRYLYIFSCFRIENRRSYRELHKRYPDVDAPKLIKLMQLRWLSHVIRMDKDKPVRMFFEVI